MDVVKEPENKVMDILKKHPEPELIFDIDRVNYISSAGLRLFLKIAKHHFAYEPETLKHSLDHCAKRIADFLLGLDSLSI